MVQQKETGRNWSFDGVNGDACGTNALFRMVKDLAGDNLICIFLDAKKSLEGNLYYADVYHEANERKIENFKREPLIQH